MDANKMMKGFIALLVLIGLTVAATPVSAQDQLQGGDTNTQVDIASPSGPIQPLSGLERLEVTITYRYQPGGADLVATPINIEVTDQPSWVVATVTPSTVYADVEETPGDDSGSTEVTATLVVQTTADAPAFEQGTISIEASAQANGNLAGSSGTANVPVRAGFYSIVTAQTPKKVVTARPQQNVDFPITVTNGGNANQNIFLSVESGAEQLVQSTVLPGTFEVASKQQGSEDNTATVTVSVQTPFQNGYINEPGVLSLAVDSAYSLDPSERGQSTRVTMLVTTKGFYVPGPGLLLSLAGMAGVALAMQRTRLGAD